MNSVLSMHIYVLFILFFLSNKEPAFFAAACLTCRLLFLIRACVRRYFILPFWDVPSTTFAFFGSLKGSACLSYLFYARGNAGTTF